jgi:4-hydroxy-4-methyl-2-oxoglutarate aldolase
MSLAPSWLTSPLACSSTPAAGALGRFETPSLTASCRGRAFTVVGAPGDNLALWRAIDAAQAGDVLVADVDGHEGTAHWGGVLSTLALHRRLAGVVLTGAVRDRAEIARLGFAAFHRGVSPRTPAKHVAGVLGAAVSIDGVVIRTGDLVVADADGVVVVPAAQRPAALAAAERLRAAERELLDRCLAAA